MLKRDEIRIRDPYVLVDREAGCYYLYGTTALEGVPLCSGASFSVYRSTDLEHFEDPVTVFDGAATGFWTQKDYWAPEVHRYNGWYYLFGTFGHGDMKMRVQILAADSPYGPFVPLSEKPLSPDGVMCLDGSFWVEDGKPYGLYTLWDPEDGHMNVICAVELSEDLKETVGEPFVLFSRRTQLESIGKSCSFLNYKVAEAPFCYRDEAGLHLLWAGYESQYEYRTYRANAPCLRGPWTFETKPVFDFDGGHAMTFTGLDGEQYITFHTPNTHLLERAVFLKMPR